MTETADGRFDKLMVFADSLSRWVEAVPCKGDPTAEQVLDAYATHVACRYGWPRELRADGGSNLANKLAEEIHRQSGVDLRQGAKYHPQSQGVAERVQATLTRMCLAANEGGSHWVDHLPFLLFSYHATPHRVTGLSPAMILYGRELRLPAQLDPSSSDADDQIPDLPAEIVEYAERHHRLLTAAWDTARESTAAVQETTFAEAWAKTDTSKSYEVDDRVCYRTYDKINKLFTPWFGPCRISEVQGSGNYLLRDLPNDMLQEVFHASQLRPYRARIDEEALSPDEYIVDRILDHRGGMPARRSYRVKWRQYPISKATWEPRAELLRRCSSLIEEYDAAHPPAPLPKERPPGPLHDGESLPRKVPNPPQPLPRGVVEALPLDPPAASAEHPHRARLDRGRWRYGRYVSTPRGLREQWFEPSAFLPSELESDRFSSLRKQHLASIPPPVAAVACRWQEYLATCAASA
jgi:hypothetical protein